MEEDVAEVRIEDIVEEPSSTRKDTESESKKMRVEGGDRPFHSNGDAGKRKREPELITAESERNSTRKDPRRRNRSRSRSPPHRRNSRSPRRRSRSKSPSREHKRGDPRANAARNRQICIDFSRGRCNKGASCKYIHEEPDERGRWSREREDSHHESVNQKQRTPRNVNPRDPRDSLRDRETTKDPRDPRNQPRDPRDPRDRPKELSRDPREPPRDKGNKREDNNNRHEMMMPGGDYPEHRGEQSQVQAPQADWTNMQPMNQWPQSLAPFSAIAASLQALQEQNFRVPPPPPPLPPSGVPPGFATMEPLVSAHADPRVHAVVDPRVTAAPPVMEDLSPDLPQQNADGGNVQLKDAEAENKSPEHGEPAESDENQNGDADAEDVEVETKPKSKKDVKAAMLVRIAVTEYVKEVLKPTWKEGHMSKDVYKTIAKKAVDKVVGTLSSHQIPRTADKVGHFMEFSRPKISKLVQGYVEKYNNK